MAKRKVTFQGGKVVDSDSLTFPTVVDMAPTALNWLGYGTHALSDFARNGFKPYYDNWVKIQHPGLIAIIHVGIWEISLYFILHSYKLFARARLIRLMALGIIIIRARMMNIVHVPSPNTDLSQSVETIKRVKYIISPMIAIIQPTINP